MSDKKTGLLAKSLGASHQDQTSTKSARLLKAGTRVSRDYVEKIESELEDMKGKREELMDVSAGIDLNRGMKGVTQEEMNKKIIEFHELSLDIELKEKHLEIAKKAHAELIGSEEEA